MGGFCGERDKVGQVFQVIQDYGVPSRAGAESRAERERKRARGKRLGLVELDCG